MQDAAEKIMQDLLLPAKDASNTTVLDYILDDPVMIDSMYHCPCGNLDHCEDHCSSVQ